MKVITLDKKAFDDACISLAEKIFKDCKPVALIGIATGGAVVARLVHGELLKELHDLRCFDLSASRASTIVKRRSNIRYVFRILPLFILDFLRIVESLMLRFNMKSSEVPERYVKFSDELLAYLKDAQNGCVYIVDDAIDSGATMSRVLAMLKEVNSALEFKVASLVVTQETPLLTPDVSLYNKVLIRFPWSDDYKKG